jgi:hypothetical protein
LYLAVVARVIVVVVVVVDVVLAALEAGAYTRSHFQLNLSRV